MAGKHVVRVKHYSAAPFSQDAPLSLLLLGPADDRILLVGRRIRVRVVRVHIASVAVE